ADVGAEADAMSAGAANLRSALDWVSEVVAACLRVHFGKAESVEPIAFSYDDDDSPLTRFIRRHQPDAEELTVLLLALAPHLQPECLGRLIAEHLPDGGDFPEFGGARGASHRGLLPTGETAQFVLAGADLEKRLAVQAM